MLWLYSTLWYGFFFTYCMQRHYWVQLIPEAAWKLGLGKEKDWSKGSIYRTAYNWIALKQEHSSILHYDCVYLNKLLLDYTLNIILFLIFNSSLSQHQFCKVLLLSLNVVVKGYKMFSCLDLRELPPNICMVNMDCIKCQHQIN